MTIIRAVAGGRVHAPRPGELLVGDAAALASGPGRLVHPAPLSQTAAWNLGLARSGSERVLLVRDAVTVPDHATECAGTTLGEGWLAVDRQQALAAGGLDETLSADAGLNDLHDRIERPPTQLGMRLGALGPWAGDRSPAIAGRISIVIPTYRRPKAMADLLSRLAPQTIAWGAELIVVNDGSHDADYAAAIAPWAGSVRYDPLPANVGRGAATNHGIGLATGEWIVFTDDDVWPPDDWLQTLAGILEEFPQLDAVGGVTRPMAHRRPGLVERFTIDRATYVPGPQFTHGDLKCLVTACLAVRVSTLRAVGGLDGAFPCGQDHNLTWRLREAGARTHATGDWWCGHDQAWKLRELTGRLSEYAYWHVKQAAISNDPVDVAANPALSWSALFGRLGGHLRWTWSRPSVRGVSPLRDFAYRVLDVMCFFAWNMGGVRAARDQSKGLL